MWISKALFDVHLLPTARQSFSPSSDTFSEEKGQTDKRRRRHRRPKSRTEAFYVKRTSQFYCPPPPPESEDFVNDFAEETKHIETENELCNEIPIENEIFQTYLPINLSEKTEKENIGIEIVAEIRVRLRKNKKRKHVVAHSTEQVNFLNLL
jgi:hypothetical protein